MTITMMKMMTEVFNFIFKESVTARSGVGLTVSAHVCKTLHWRHERSFLFLRNMEPLSGELDEALLRQIPNVRIFPLPSTMSCGPRELSRYRDSLRAGRSEDRIPVWERPSVPVQTVRGYQPASCTIDTGSLPGVKRQGRGVDQPPPSSTMVKERVKLYLLSSSGP